MAKQKAELAEALVFALDTMLETKNSKGELLWSKDNTKWTAKQTKQVAWQILKQYVLPYYKGEDSIKDCGKRFDEAFDKDYLFESSNCGKQVLAAGYMAETSKASPSGEEYS